MKISIKFHNHPCTNHTGSDYHQRDEDCDTCGYCRCDEAGHCCGEERQHRYCPDCGDEIEFPRCYACGGEMCAACEDGQSYASGEDVYYSGTIEAEWENGTLTRYYSTYGHPHINGASYCLGDTARLFEGVETKEKAVEAVVTHISNINFNDAVGGPFDGIGA